MLEVFSFWQFALVGVIGLLAGCLGGMLGAGGSVIMIPGLVLLLGRPSGSEQHLYQASAMLANVFVSVPAVMRHRKAGALRPDALRWMVPSALLFVVVGVALSNLPMFSGPGGSLWLGRLLAVFLLYVVVVNVLKLLNPHVETDVPLHADAESRSGDEASGTTRSALTVGAIMGALAGLLGIGGGAVAVPLQQALMRLPLRECIANSSAVICVSSAVGAVYKIASLGQHASLQPHADLAIPIDWVSGLTLGLLLAPTCFLGGRLGATLTHTLPLPAVRACFVVLMLISAWKVAGF